MSTKATLWYDSEYPEFHLYEEAFDHEFVYLSVQRGGKYYDEDVVIRIPNRVWKEMRKHGPYTERYLDMTDEELREEVMRQVKRHREWLDAHKDEWARIAGIVVFGPPEGTEQEMYDLALAYYREIRGEHKENELG